MEWIIEHWKLLAGIIVVLGVLIAVVVGVSSSIPSSEALKEWSIQEAIFYGFCVLAFATFIAR